MKNILILGKDASSAHEAALAECLKGRKEIAYIHAANPVDAQNRIAESRKYLLPHAGMNLREFLPQNLSKIDALYLADGNAYLLLDYLLRNQLVPALCERVQKDLLIIAAGSASLVLGPSLRTALCAPLAEPGVNSGLNLLAAHLMTGEFAEQSRRALKEFFAVGNLGTVIFVPSNSCLHLLGDSALVLGLSGVIKILAGNEHFYKDADYIHL